VCICLTFILFAFILNKLSSAKLTKLSLFTFTVYDAVVMDKVISEKTSLADFEQLQDDLYGIATWSLLKFYLSGAKEKQ
jgi:hypothetical protein